jgi:hypothetical protein
MECHNEAFVPGGVWGESAYTQGEESDSLVQWSPNNPQGVRSLAVALVKKLDCTDFWREIRISLSWV